MNTAEQLALIYEWYEAIIQVADLRAKIAEVRRSKRVYEAQIGTSVENMSEAEIDAEIVCLTDELDRLKRQEAREQTLQSTLQQLKNEIALYQRLKDSINAFVTARKQISDVHDAIEQVSSAIPWVGNFAVHDAASLDHVVAAISVVETLMPTLQQNVITLKEIEYALSLGAHVPLTMRTNVTPEQLDEVTTKILVCG